MTAWLAAMKRRPLRVPPPRTWAKLLVAGAKRVRPIVVENSWLCMTIVVSAVMAVAVTITMVLPGYMSPLSRITTSKFGYPSLYRKLKKPFPVPAVRPTRRKLSHTALGEGLVRTEPVTVPIIPMGKFSRVLVKEGDSVKKGQLLAEVDATKATIKADAARAALNTAKAELERVKIGSAYVLEKERPERDTIRLEVAEKEAALRKQLLDIQSKLAQRGFASKVELLRLQIELTELEGKIREARFNLTMSTKGSSQSLVIAESAVREAELALQHRTAELTEYRVLANADGRIERCMVHEGEYNQDPGKPGFLIAAESWFEANFDQGSYRRVTAGDEATVRLEAYPDRSFRGRVTWVNPFVAYDLGGPESNRPIRPMGTGAPEWPATFAARVAIVADGPPVVPGMTGFCLIRTEVEALCLPREAVSSMTAGTGIVYEIKGDRFEPREVTLGVVDGDWIEVLSGLKTTDEVIRDGYQILEKTDRIKVTPEKAGAP